MSSIDLQAGPLAQRLQQNSFSLSNSEIQVMAREADTLLLPLLGGAKHDKVLEIIGEIATHVESSVRRALSASIASSPLVPRDLAMKLASDIDDVATPMLELSKVLTDDDILALIERRPSDAKLCAIACREQVSDPVCDALVTQGSVDVAIQLARNSGAALSETSLTKLIEAHAANSQVHHAIITRKTLPIAIIPRLIDVISDELLTLLSERHQLDAALKEELLLDARERAVIGLTSGISSRALMHFVRELEMERRITPSLLVRGAILGNLEFVVHALARLNMADVTDTRARILEAPETELARLWPIDWEESQLAIITTAVRTMRSVDVESQKWPPKVYRFLVSQRILSTVGEAGGTISDEEFDAIDAAARGLAGSVAELLDPWAMSSQTELSH